MPKSTDGAKKGAKHETDGRILNNASNKVNETVPLRQVMAQYLQLGIESKPW